MPTLFRLLATLALVFALGYAAMFALATFAVPEPREMLETVTWPLDPNVRVTHLPTSALGDGIRRRADPAGP